MKKYLTKRNILIVATILCFLIAILFAFVPSWYWQVLTYDTRTHEFKMLGFGYPIALAKYGCIVVYRLVIVCIFAMLFLVCSIMLSIDIFKQYRQEHPRKPSNKQRIAELEKQIAELKQNQKD